MMGDVTGRILHSACVEDGQFTYGSNQYTQTLRHKLCKLPNLGTEEVCGPCKIYQSDIASMKKSDTSKRIKASSHSKLSSFSREELIERCRSLQGERLQLTRANVALKRQIENLMHAEAIELTDNQSKVMLQCVDGLENVLPNESFERRLWDEQLKAVKSEKKHEMASSSHAMVNCHPIEIFICIQSLERSWISKTSA